MNWFINTLSWWQWALLAAVPPAIIALYFLKLRRQPLEVPSTFLWHRTIEDLHVNSLWQRLRQSILLLLQLLLILLVMGALLRPGWKGRQLVGDRFIFLIDSSASMSSQDEKPSRLEVAKKRVAEMIDQMKSGDVAMIVEFNDRAVPVQQFTDNRFQLRRSLENIKPTNRTSNIGEALRLAAGLANPAVYREKENPQLDADAQPAEMFIFTDGRFDAVSDFQFGNLNPKYMILGQEESHNVGIVAFSAERNTERPDQLQAVCRLEKFGSDAQSVVVTLLLDGVEIDAAEAKFGDSAAAGVAFPLADLESGTLKASINYKDDFPVDNEAFAAVNVPRKAKVLMITPRNDALELALATEEAVKAADVTIAEPKFLETKAYGEQMASAAFDLVIYDQVSPQEMPQCNTLFIGSLPPGTKELDILKTDGDDKPGDDKPDGADETPATEEENEPDADEGGSTMDEAADANVWKAGPRQPAPYVIDTDRSHPLMQFVELGNVRIAEARPLDPPPGGSQLIDTDVGTIFAIAPRKSFEDAVMGFEIYGVDPKTKERFANTDWPIRRSFPIFIMNALHYLGGQGGAQSTGTVQPGKTITIRTDSPVEELIVQAPNNEKTRITREGQATFTFSKTDQLGVYDVLDAKTNQPVQRFAVNLFDPGESNIHPKKELDVGGGKVEGTSSWQPMRKEMWKYILLIGLGVLIVEWWIWNRRVYL